MLPEKKMNAEIRNTYPKIHIFINRNKEMYSKDTNVLAIELWMD